MSRGSVVPAGSAFLLELCARARSFPRAQEVFRCWWELGEMFLLFSFSWLCLPWGLSILTLCRVDLTKHPEVVFTPCSVLRAGQPRVQERACLSPVSSGLPQ